jgi:hypothetical protein
MIPVEMVPSEADGDPLAVYTSELPLEDRGVPIGVKLQEHAEHQDLRACIESRKGTYERRR